jgi:hypothetical protein
LQLRARSFCFRRTITGIDLDDSTSRFYVDKASDSLDDDAQALSEWFRSRLASLFICLV